jgi:hypothetical protein
MALIAVAISLIEMSSVRLSSYIKTHSTSLDTPFMLIQRGLPRADVASTAKHTPEKQKLVCVARRGPRGVFASPRVCAEPDAAN